MENNEDEPDDVKKATPVESAILEGDKDEKKQSVKGKKPKSASSTVNDRDETKIRRYCNLYGTKFPPPATKIKKPCHPRTEIICRDNLSKDEYIEVLSTPKKSRGLSCKQAKVESIDSPNGRFASGGKTSCKEKAALPRPISQRLKELAKPKPSHIMDLLQTWGGRLRPEIIDSVQKSLEENCAMSPEQMEAYYNEKEGEDCGRVRRVRRKKCPASKEKKKSSCDDHMDRQAVCEEYEMAQRFMRHIISHLKNSQFAPEDYYDLTEVILTQLGNVLDYRPSGDGDRKFQMMFMLANGIASWVHGLNVAVAEKLAKQQTENEKEGIETEESGEEDEEEEGPSMEVTEATEEEGEEDEEDKGDEKEEDEGDEKEEDEGDEKEEDDGDEKEEKVEDEDDENKDREEETEVDTEEKNILSEDEGPVMEMENGEEDGNDPVTEATEETYAIDTDDGTDVNAKSETEEVADENEVKEQELEELAEEKEDTEPEAEISEMGEESKEEELKEDESKEEDEIEDEELEMEEETVEDIPSIESTVEPGLAIAGLGEGDLFESEIPFITFGKIMEIVVKFLDKFEEAETTEVRRRLQNAILKKLTKLVLAEAPDALDNNMKAVLEVLAENIAVFMEDTLPSSKVNDIETMAPEIESTEVRNWGHWLDTVMDNATNWGKWIHEKVGEAEEKARTKVTRGDWQDWTRTVNSEALRWRMFNLDTKHHMHHADLNITHKKVVHRGGIGIRNVMGSAGLAPYPEKDETEINAYDLLEEEEP